MYRKILVPINDSEPARAALHEVVKMAADLPRLIRLFHVVDISHPNGNFPDGSVGDIVIKSRREGGQKLLAEGREVLSGHGVDCDAILVESQDQRAADTILAAATEWPADLIVMGTHGRKGLSRLVLGSNAAEVVRAAPVPVLLVRGISHTSSELPAR
jgi:nucleotide-binding universal stress UspA family protein